MSIQKFALLKFLTNKNLTFTITGFNRTDGTLQQIRRNPYDYKCGGTVINKHYILTAAHCMKNQYPRYAFTTMW